MPKFIDIVKMGNISDKLKNPKVLAGIAIALVAVVIVVVVVLILQNNKYAEAEEQHKIEVERIALQYEYDKLADEYNEYEQFRISNEGKLAELGNDSLLQLYEAERLKVQRIQEELKSERATSAARIAQLQAELETMRGVMRNLIVQIDSLNRENAQLRTENTTIRNQYYQTSQQLDIVSQQRDSLDEKVTIASKLDAVNVTVSPIKKNGKVAKKIKDINKLKITFSVAKNVTAATGEKQIYARIRKPDGDILIKNEGDVFDFEGSSIPYSCCKSIEFAGEEINGVEIYWDVEEYLYPGLYEVEIFADNYVIGRGSFELKK